MTKIPIGKNKVLIHCEKKRKRIKMSCSCENSSFVIWQWNTPGTPPCGRSPDASEIHLVIVRHCVGQHVADGAGGDGGAGGAAQGRRGRCRRGGLLGMLQLLPVYFPLFGTPVLEPDLHLRQHETQEQCMKEGWGPTSTIIYNPSIMFNIRSVIFSGGSSHHPPSWQLLL